jgi:hypothetical protein
LGKENEMAAKKSWAVAVVGPLPKEVLYVASKKKVVKFAAKLAPTMGKYQKVVVEKVAA